MDHLLYQHTRMVRKQRVK